jgi:hypothetical protein
VAELAPIPTRSVSLDSKAVRFAKLGTVWGSLFVSLAILTKWFSFALQNGGTEEPRVSSLAVRCVTAGGSCHLGRVRISLPVKMEGYELSTGARRVNRVASVQRGSEDVFLLPEGPSACAASLYLAPA